MDKPHFRYTRRINFGETDLAGLVHFSNYFRIIEEAEHAFLESLSIPVIQSGKNGILGMPKASIQCSFRQPLTFRDQAEVLLKISRLGKSSITLEFEVQKAEVLVAEGNFTLVFCTIESSSTEISKEEIPPEWRKRLEQCGS